MTPRLSAPADEARAPFVVGIDIGSGGSRAALYDATGREVGRRKHKVLHTFTTGADGTSTIDADQVVDEILEALDAVLDGWTAPIAAIGVDTFASSILAVGADGRALTPCITYADTRCRDQAARLRETLDGERLHDVTGTRIHSSYNTARLMWLRETQPDVVAKAARFMALGEYAAARLLGEGALGTAGAAWGGMLDRRSGGYVDELLETAGVSADQLGAPTDPADGPTVDAASLLGRRFPVLAGARWVPVVGDGLCANIGIGATGDGAWGISTATSGAIRVLLSSEVLRLPGGLWAYRVDRQRTLVGSAMSDCGRVLDFARATFRLPDAPAALGADAAGVRGSGGPLAGIDTEALFSAPPAATTPLVVPFLSGERGTKWRDAARAIWAGVSPSTTPEDMLRGSMEGLALSFLRIADQLRSIGGAPSRIRLSGGMTGAVPAWTQILADALGTPVDHVDVSRSTMRGAALLALEGCDGADVADAPVARRFEPVADATAHYRERLARFEALADLA